MLNFALSQEQEKLKMEARDFALKEILPLAWYYDQIDAIPVDVLKKAHKAGIMNADIPKKYGGRELGLIEAAIITEEIAAACPGLATSIFDNSLGMEPLILSDKETLKEKYLSEVVKNSKLICFATSEPLMGSDVSGVRCTAEKQGDDYILNGTKYWITNAGIADYMTVFATTDPEKKHAGICAFVVERDQEGVTVGKTIPKMGQKSSNTAGWNFKNVRVKAENVLAGEGEGFALAMKTFSRTRPIIGAFAVGAARSAMEYAIDYAKKRRAFGTKISNFQAIQHKIAEMYQKVETSRLLVYKSAWEADNGIDPTVNASIAKFYATESAMEVVSEALQIMGGYGYTKYFPVEQLFRDTRLFMIYEGTSEVQRMIVSGFALNSYVPAMPALEDLPVNRDFDPLSDENRDKKVWRCRMCGYVHEGEEAPEECPLCFFPGSAFKRIE
jgi:acyl-CoA dehydrogenase